MNSHKPAAAAERVPQPRRTGKDVDGLYGYADDIDNGVRGLRSKLEALFREYRFAEFEAEGGNAVALKQEATAGNDASRATTLSDELSDELEQMLCQIRGAMTTLRVLLAGWEGQHGPQRPFSESDAMFAASLEFCANGVEAMVNQMSERISEACGDTADAVAGAGRSSG